MVDSPDNTGPDTSKVEPEAKQKELPKHAKLGDIIRKKFKSAGLQVKTALGDEPDEIVINPMTESAAVSKNRHAVVSFGRMGIFTNGHKKLTDKVKAVAKKVGGTASVYLSKTQDAKKNPLSYEDKLRYAKIGSGGVVKHSDARNIMEVAAQHHGQAEHLHVVVGGDRVKEFHDLLHKYNGKEGAAHGFYHYKSITVHNAGDRDPDAEGTEGISASKMREHASNNDTESFKQGLPDSLKPHAGEMMHKVRKGMKLEEESLKSILNSIFEEKSVKAIPTPGSSNIRPTKYPNGAGDVGMDSNIEVANGPIDQANKTVQRKRGAVVKRMQGPLDLDEMGTLDQRALQDLEDRTPKKESRLTPWERIQKKRRSHKKETTTVNEHIVKLPSGKYRLLSHKGKNLGTFDSHEAAAKHEGEVEYFKTHNEGFDVEESAAWQRKEGKNPTGGLNDKGIASYRAENPGSHLQKAVTGKVKPGSKAANRRKSFCARMSGVPGPMKDDKGRPTRKALSLRKWKCHEENETGGLLEDKPCWKQYKQLGMKKKNGKEVPNCVPKEE